MSNLYRHEQKYICSKAQMKHLLEVLKTVLPQDTHQKGSYHIKSLYFDTINNRFLEESLNGVEKRIKYRLRRYDKEKQDIKFECKSSYFHLKQKRFIWLKKNEIEAIFKGKDEKTLTSNPLLEEFYCLKKTERIEPKIIIDYDRTAFVHESSNTRITLDQNIVSSLDVDLFFDDNVSGRNILPSDAGILEVKFDEILPTYIVQILGLEDLEQTAFSKYVMGRLAYKRND